MTNTAFKTIHTPAEPRFKPIENPDSFKLKMAYWFIKRRLGKVITPVKVHYPRFPAALGLAGELAKLHNRFTIAPQLQHLIQVYTATVNGCAFCVDIGRASAQNKKLNPGIFDDLLRFEESERYTAAEKAALAYVDEVNRNKHVSDNTFERLQIHFSEEAIIQITTLNAIENLYNLMNAPLNIGSDELCELIR